MFYLLLSRTHAFQQILTSLASHRFSDVYTDVRFYKLDVDEVPDVAQELGIRAMPTFVIFKDGEKVSEVVGANPKALEAAIQKHNEETTAKKEEA